MSGKSQENPPPLNKLYYPKSISEEEKALYKKRRLSNFAKATIPVLIVNLAMMYMFRSYPRYQRYQRIWFKSISIQSLIVLLFTKYKAKRDVIREHPQGYWSQRRRSAFRQEYDRHMEEFVNNHLSVFELEPITIEQDVHAEYLFQSDETKLSSMSKQKKADKLYRSSKQEAPQSGVKLQTCVQAREEKYRLPPLPWPPSHSAQFDHMQSLNLFDTSFAGSSNCDSETSRQSRSVPLIRKEPEKDRMKREQPIKRPANSYKLWRQQVLENTEPLPQFETCSNASQKEWRYAVPKVQPAWQTEVFDREYDYSAKKRQSQIEEQQNKPRTQPYTPKTKVRRNIYGDITEPNFDGKGR